MDPIDYAQERAAQDTESAITAARTGPRLIPCGACHWCSEIIQPDRNFCDPGCRDDWQADQARKHRNGRVMP